MATDARLHSAFSSTEHPSMAGLNALSLSINDVMPVSNATTQVSQAAAVAAAGVSFATNPLVTIRADAPGLHRIESSYDGLVFVPASGVLHFASTSARDTWTTANSALLTTEDMCVAAGDVYRWESSAWVPLRSYYYAYTSTAQSIPNASATQVTLSSATSYHSPDITGVGDGTVTIETAGLYKIDGYVAFMAGGSSSTRGLQLLRNGVALPSTWSVFQSNQVQPCHAFSVVSCAAGDTITMQAYQSSGASLSTNAATGGYNTSLSIERLD